MGYSFGVFFKPVAAEFGWVKAVTSAAYSFSAIMSGILGIFAARLADKIGVRAVCIASGIFVGLAYILMSQISVLWQFYIIYGLVLAAGLGGIWPALMAAVPKWFTRRKGMVCGIIAAGIGFGTILLPPLITRAIELYSWRSAYTISGIVATVIIVVASLFMKNPDGNKIKVREQDSYSSRNSVHDPHLQLSLRQMLRSRNFWVLATAYLCFGFSLHTIMVHIVPHSIELGITPVLAATVLSVIGGTSILSKLVFGGVSDKLGFRLCLIIGLALALIGLLFLQISSILWMLYIFAFIFGCAYGSVITMQPLIASEYFGLSSLGSIIGFINFSYTMGIATGPLVSGYIFDITGDYKIAFFLAAFLSAIAVIIVPTSLKVRGNNELR